MTSTASLSFGGGAARTPRGLDILSRLTLRGFSSGGVVLMALGRRRRRRRGGGVMVQASGCVGRGKGGGSGVSGVFLTRGGKRPKKKGIE